MTIKGLFRKLLGCFIWGLRSEAECLHNGQPCRKTAISPDKSGTCGCITCHAWLSKNIDGYNEVHLAAELEATKRHLDAAYEAARVSHFSSRPLSHYIQDYVEVIEHYAEVEKTLGGTGPASKTMRWTKPFDVTCPLCEGSGIASASTPFPTPCMLCKGATTVRNDGSHV